MTKQTAEAKLKKLQIKYAHERDALIWALDKAFEMASDEMNVDDCFHFSTLQRLAKQYELGDSERWDKLGDDIHAAAKDEDDAEALADKEYKCIECGAEFRYPFKPDPCLCDLCEAIDKQRCEAELEGDIERDEHD